MGFVRVPNNSETDMWQKRLIAILDVYLSQIGTKLLHKRENCICKELKNFAYDTIFGLLCSQIIAKLFSVTNLNPAYTF